MNKKSDICPWAGDDPLYIKYHNEEWGVPNASSHALFEKLILEGFQAGLSWITILRKRENFRTAFDGFDPEKIARYTDRKIETLMKNEGIIRNRAKIEATRTNAQAYLKFSETSSLAEYLWDFVDGQPIQNSVRHFKDIPAQTELSAKISKSLKQNGFRFVGPTTVYAFMQSMGFVNDHLLTCPRYKDCAKLANKFNVAK